MIYSDKFNDEEKQALLNLQQHFRWTDNKVDWLIASIGFISNFNPKYRNTLPISRAGGYASFTPKQCKKLGTTTEKLVKMSGAEQIKLIQKFLYPYKHRIFDPIDIVTLFMGFPIDLPPEGNMYVSELAWKPEYRKSMILPKSRVENDLNQFYARGKEYAE